MPRKRSGGGMGGGMLGEAGIVRSLQSFHADLVSQRDLLDQRISKLEAALDAVGGGAMRGPAMRTGGGRKPQISGIRPGSLKDHIRRVLERNGGAMAVKDITNGVTKAGYKSKNKTLAKSVGIALTEIQGVKKLGRGTFAIA